ncbi:MAG: hypothetical protein HY986_21795 [Candidatus Melainabacteria bacterium]|nr:hypothetical protein [Candidatus Melainabacteria bacterium]
MAKIADSALFVTALTIAFNAGAAVAQSGDSGEAYGPLLSPQRTGSERGVRLSRPQSQPPKHESGGEVPPLAHATCKERVEVLTSELVWYKSLSRARAEAERSGKPIFWVHMLGQIDGNTCAAASALRAVSLSKNPVYSILKDDFVVGYKNIDGKPFAGIPHQHGPDENVGDTTNGVGAHNLQLFVLAPDGTVLTCLPGYWSGPDLAYELAFARDLYQLWKNAALTVDEKRAQYSSLHLAHISTHSQAMKNRSHLPEADLQWEGRNLENSEFFYQQRAVNPNTGKTPLRNVKTIDIVMHERLARQPFVLYQDFDAAAFADFGRPLSLLVQGDAPAAAPSSGNQNKGNAVKSAFTRTGKSLGRTTVNHAIRYGIRSILP